MASAAIAHDAPEFQFVEHGPGPGGPGRPCPPDQRCRQPGFPFQARPRARPSAPGFRHNPAGPCVSGPRILREFIPGRHPESPRAPKRSPTGVIDGAPGVGVRWPCAPRSSFLPRPGGHHESCQPAHVPEDRIRGRGRRGAISAIPGLPAVVDVLETQGPTDAGAADDRRLRSRRLPRSANR